jgi:hypothetical protein
MIIFSGDNTQPSNPFENRSSYDPGAYYDVVSKSELHDFLKDDELMTKMQYLADMAVELPNLDATIDILYSGELNLAELILPLLKHYKMVVDEMKSCIPNLDEMSENAKIAAIMTQYSSWGQFYCAILTEFCLNYHPIQECLEHIANIKFEMSPREVQIEEDNAKIAATGSFTSSINNLLVQVIKRSCAQVDDIYVYDAFRLIATTVGLFTAASNSMGMGVDREVARKYCLSSRLDLNQIVNTWLKGRFEVKPFYQAIHSVDALAFLLATQLVHREMSQHFDPDLDRNIKVINSNPINGAPFQILFQNYFLPLDALKNAHNSIECRLLKYLIDNYGGTLTISTDVVEDKLTYTHDIGGKKGMTYEKGLFVGTIVKFSSNLYKKKAAEEE